ncbi:MAG: hypothetical protein HY226_06050 [Candidatus Vogelbacteria bacterium]|nr:hypothetical protein [Candidatus Vogelbacteria bacterium]
MKTYILVMRYRKMMSQGHEWEYQNVTIETTEPLTLDQIKKVEKDTAARLKTWDSLCKLHNLITLG